MVDYEREMTIEYLKGIQEKYVEGEGYDRHPLPEWWALDNAIKTLEQEDVLDKIRTEIKNLKRFEIRGEKTPLVNVDRALDIVDKYRK